MSDQQARDLDEKLKDIVATIPRKSRTLEAINEQADQSITDLGRLSAEAVMKQWETAATGVEALGKDVREILGKLRDQMAECDADLKHLAETAAAIRERGKLARVQIERASAVSDDIRATCEGLRKKLEG